MKTKTFWHTDREYHVQKTETRILCRRMVPVRIITFLGLLFAHGTNAEGLCEASPGGISCWPVNFYCLGRKLLYSLALNKCHWLIHYGLWHIPSQSSGEVLPNLGSSLLNCILSVMCKPTMSSSRGSVLRHWSKHVPSCWYLVTDGGIHQGKTQPWSFLLFSFKLFLNFTGRMV